MIVLITLLSMAYPARGETRLFMAAEGDEWAVPASGTTTLYLQANATARAMVWLDDQGSGQTLNFYAIILDWFCDGLDSGVVQYVDDGTLGGNSAVVDAARADWVFVGFDIGTTAYSERESENSFGFIVARESLSDGDLVMGLNYLGEFDLTSSADAAGTCQIDYLLYHPIGAFTSLGQAHALEPYSLSQTQHLQVTITTCGDGVITPNEACDDGNNTPDDGCSPTCELECGDGHVGPLEECDDGNRLNGDGCSDDCHVERGFQCRGEPSFCFADAPAVSRSGMVLLVVVLIALVAMTATLGRRDPAPARRLRR